MRSRVTLLRHPLHPILVMFPVAMLPLLVVLDAAAIYATDAPGLWTAGFLVAALGGILALVASVPGVVDLAAIPNETPAHKKAVWHLFVGILIIAIYAATTYLRWPMEATPASPAWVLGVDAFGTLAVLFQGWLGGELVYKHHVGVDAKHEGGDPTDLKEGPGLHVPPARSARREVPK